jgi:hypothetical protein
LPPKDNFNYSVQVDSMIKMADQLDMAAKEFYEKAKPNAADATIPMMSWPMTAYLGAMQKYVTTQHSVAAATDAADRGLRAINSALHTVATNYMKAENASTLGLESSLPSAKPYAGAPPRQEHSGVGSTTAWALGDVAIDVALASTFQGLLVAVSAPSGAATLFNAVHLAAVAVNLRIPAPFFMVRGNWNEVAQSVNTARGNIMDNVTNFQSEWTGEAADAFVAYMDSLTKFKLPPLGVLANDVADAMGTAGWALIEFFIKIIIADGVALGALYAALSAAAVPPLMAGLQWAVAIAWAAFVASCVEAIISTYKDVDLKLNKAANDATNIAGQFFSDSRHLDDSKMTPNPTMVSVDQWHKNWVKK